MTTRLLAAVLIAAGAFCAGCGARQEYRADRLSLVRTSWDSVMVDVTFVRSTVVGGDAEVRPESVIVSVFDESYELLYEGPSGVAPVPDDRLGSGERLTVEACGVIRSRPICVQNMLRASPKRLSMDEEIVYPADSDLSEGLYDFSFQVERQVYGGESWERVEAEGVEGFVDVWVEDDEAREQGVVRFPFESNEGRFDLSRHDNYKNFRYYLDSALMDEEEAGVTFSIYAGLSDRPSRLATVTKTVEQKTEDERAEDVRYFVEQATERIIDELSSFLGGRRAVAFVEDWEYDRLARRYRVRMEAEWEGPIFNRGDFELEGELEVEEDGSSAVFRIRSGNRRAVSRWRDRIDGDSMSLGSLDVRRMDLRPSASL